MDDLIKKAKQFSDRIDVISKKADMAIAKSNEIHETLKGLLISFKQLSKEVSILELKVRKSDNLK